MNHYNGYTPQEREKKLRASHRLFPEHSHPYHKPPCHLCGDPTSKVEPHSEDYSEPFLWEKPAEYAVCKVCHSRLHKRFKNPSSWTAYKMHIKRGGWGSDLKQPSVARELRKLTEALVQEKGVQPLAMLRDVAEGERWWEQLTVDPASLTGSWARPRK